MKIIFLHHPKENPTAVITATRVLSLSSLAFLQTLSSTSLEKTFAIKYLETVKCQFHHLSSPAADMSPDITRG